MFAITSPYPQIFDLDGSPLDGGKIYFGQVGTNPVVPSNRIPVYWDEAGTQPVAQPVTISNGYIYRSGSPAVVFAGIAYSIAVYNKSGRLVAYARDAQLGSGFSVGLELQAYKSEVSGSGGSDVVGFIQSGPGSVARTMQSKGRERLTPLDKGAAGDGSGNDTSALSAAIGDGRSIELSDGQYLATPPTSANAPSISKAGAHISGPGALKVRPGTYYKGTPGAEDNYSFYKLTGDGAIVCGITFDGNGQASLTPYNPTGPNVQFFPVLLYGTGGGQKAVMLDTVNSGGHAVEAFYGRRKVVALGSFKGHNGAVMNGVTSAVLALCMSEDATDSHYNFGGNSAGVAVGLVGKNNVSNGGGIDIDGGNDIVLSASVFRDGQSFGVWPRENAQTGAAPLERLLITGVLSHNNCNFPRDEQAEIMLGNPNNLAAVPGHDWAVSGNLIVPIDTPPAGGYNAGVWVHPLLERAAIVGNVFSGDLFSSGARAFAVKHMGGKDIFIENNVSLKPGALVYFAAPPRGVASYRGNANMRIPVDSPYVPTQMDSSDGKWEYSIVRILPKSGMAFVTIDYLGGFCHDSIEVELLQEGDTGYRKRRFVVRGANGQTPTILDNTTEFFGTAPPEVTIAPGTSSLVIGGFTNAAAAASGYACSIYIKIRTPYDGAARFRPAFTY